MLESGLNDLLELVVCIPGKRDTCQPETGADFVAECTFREIHCIGYSEHDQPTVS